jgi:SOS response regulatory protein OraA/RecX
MWMNYDMDRKAARYIDHQMQQGHTPVDIDAALRRQGFDSHDIVRAWRQAHSDYGRIVPFGPGRPAL